MEFAAGVTTLVFGILSLFSLVAAQQCPALTSIYPPSGLRNQQVFKISGENLDGVDSVGSSIGTITTSAQNDSTITFTIDVSGPAITVSLIPTDMTNCVTLTDTINVKGPSESI